MKNKPYVTGAEINMRLLIFFLVIFGLLLQHDPQSELIAQQLNNEVPKVINFSGVITGDDNNLVSDGEYNILFSLYTSLEGGDPVWSESHDKVFVENGEINVLLGGAAVPSPLNLPFNRQYYLGIKLNGNDELKPRIELLPAPFSIRTLVADNIKDNSITSDKIAPNSITDSKIKSVSWNKIKDLQDIKKINSNPAEEEKDQAVLPNYWRRYGNYLSSGNEFLGTINDRNLVIKTDSIQRMLFDPYGKVVMGTVTDSVFFEVIGKTTLGNTYVKAKMGVGADFNETESKVHIKTTGTQIPFKVDNTNTEAFLIESSGRVEITSRQTGEEDDEDNYSMFINAEDQGIAVKVNGDISNSDINYMTFWDEDGIAGRIEGMDGVDFLSDPKNIAHDAWFVLQGVAFDVALGAGPLEIPDAINGVAEIAYYEFQKIWDATHLGVAYESGSGDYAEWLEKLNHAEIFSAGDIVGVYGGKISKNTKNAEQIMSVSLSPVVLGNMPAKDQERYFEKVAFKGQVPVKVKGIVHYGDYIIPSGLNDGMGIAVEPCMMTADEFAKAVGRAWEENLNDEIKFINAAVGLKMKDIAKSIRLKYNENQKLETALAEKNKELDSILSQLKEVEEGVKLAKSRLPQNTSSAEQKYTLNKIN